MSLKPGKDRAYNKTSKNLKQNLLSHHSIDLISIYCPSCKNSNFPSKKEATVLSHCVVSLIPSSQTIDFSCLFPVVRVFRKLWQLHFAIGQLIPDDCCSMCSSLSEKYPHGCTTQAQSQESVSCMTTFWVHSFTNRWACTCFLCRE